MVEFLLPPSGSRRGTIPTATLIDALAGELGGGNIFIFRPGGEASGNVYTSWALLHAALLSVEGPRVIFIDTSVEATAVIPVGEWDASNTVFVGKGNVAGSSGDRLSILGSLQDAAGFENLVITKAVDGEDSPALDFTTKGRCVLRGCILGTLHATFAAVRTGSPARVELDLYNTDVQTPLSGASGVIHTNDADGTYLNIYDGTRLRDNALHYEGGTTLVTTRTLFCEISSTQSNGGGTLAVSSGVFSYDRANYALEAEGLPRFGPWRSAAEAVSPGLSYDAGDRERVLLSGSLLPAETFTVNVPTTGSDPAPEGSSFTVKNVNTPPGVALALIVNTGDGFIEDVGTRGFINVSTAFDLAPGGYLTWEKQGGTWFIVGEGGLA